MAVSSGPFWGGDTAFSPGLLNAGEGPSGLDSSVTRSLKGTRLMPHLNTVLCSGELAPSTHGVILPSLPITWNQPPIDTQVPWHFFWQECGKRTIKDLLSGYTAFQLRCRA
jgi:hypothetical protein